MLMLEAQRPGARYPRNNLHVWAPLIHSRIENPDFDSQAARGGGGGGLVQIQGDIRT